MAEIHPVKQIVSLHKLYKFETDFVSLRFFFICFWTHSFLIYTVVTIVAYILIYLDLSVLIHIDFQLLFF